jgi:hypothetical protein
MTREPRPTRNAITPGGGKMPEPGGHSTARSGGTCPCSLLKSLPGAQRGSSSSSGKPRHRSRCVASTASRRQTVTIPVPPITLSLPYSLISLRFDGFLWKRSSA